MNWIRVWPSGSSYMRRRAMSAARDDTVCEKLPDRAGCRVSHRVPYRNADSEGHGRPLLFFPPPPPWPSDAPLLMESLKNAQ